jgi:TonB family protein
MSKTRSISSLAAGLGILALACWFVTATFPLAAAPQLVADGPGVTVDTGGAVMHRTSIAYPESARAKRIQGVVTVEATVDSSGNVVDTRILNGPIELRRAAQQSVLNWHFAVDTSMNTRMVKVNFELLAETAASAGVPSQAQPMDAASREALRAQVGDKPLTARVAPPLPEGRRLTSIYIGGLSDQSRKDLMSRLPVHPGDTLAADSLERLRAAVREFDEHLSVGTATISNSEMTVTIQMPGSGASGEWFGNPGSGGVIGGVPGGVIGGVPGGVVGGIIAAVPSVSPPADGTKRITIGGNVQQAKLISQPKPVYPPLAKQAHVSGVVHLQAIIGKEGNVMNLAVISGHPLLISSAMEAVRQWVYHTTLLNGEPVEVITQIDVNYALSDDPPVQQ